MLRLLLAEDHELMRRGLRSLVDEHPGWAVCGEARTGREAVALAAQLQPDIALLALVLPELNGIEATRQIRRVAPHTQVLIVTMREAAEVVREALGAGAHGYVLKSDAEPHLVAAVEALAQHRPYVSPRVAALLPPGWLTAGRPPDARFREELTGREREILQLLAEGKSNSEVATALVLSAKTVETHRATIMRKLGLRSIVELVRYALRNHIIAP
jgi:DNA-binding NarL/FixJ family response regulator